MLTDFYDISQGSVVMHMRSVGIFSCPLTRYSLLSLSVKKLLIGQRLSKLWAKMFGTCFLDAVYYLFRKWECSYGCKYMSFLQLPVVIASM